MTRARSLSKKFLYYFVLVLAALLVMAGVLEYRARSEVNLARKALDRSEFNESLKHYSRALNWYVPFGAAETAAREMLDLGLKLKSQGRDDDARLTLSRLRSGLYGARSIYTPRVDLIKRAEPHLAELMARAKLGEGAKKPSLEATTRTYLDLFARPSRPQTGPALAAAGGFLIWISGALVFIIRFSSFKRGWGQAWPWALVWAAGFIIWLWGLKWA
ncbi:MAG: hypothetical protein JRG97_14160 [Deltaproteobacteria bacterium]|nr:hypothetical protein [Deltaproteobacteria bacterium]MBW2053626.1 hypothetical protein [Deltaproteobacteria bacterium]MBW2142185.1 hypothetical protein [Deltaproteobacteria bacterium]MBW2324164.1 hypothetical protein [Deltaproteobacteria bacterium]